MPTWVYVICHHNETPGGARGRGGVTGAEGVRGGGGMACWGGGGVWRDWRSSGGLGKGLEVGSCHTCRECDGEKGVMDDVRICEYDKGEKSKKY